MPATGAQRTRSPEAARNATTLRRLATRAPRRRRERLTGKRSPPLPKRRRAARPRRGTSRSEGSKRPGEARPWSIRAPRLARHAPVPWQRPHVERLIGSIRRECLDHTIVVGEQHLRRILRSYFAYYHGARTH